MKNKSTKETCPRHIWMEEVVTEAIKLFPGVSAAACHAGDGMLRDRMNRAYDTGEAVWMMAEELALRVRMMDIDRRATTDGDFNRALLARYGV